MGLYQKSDFGCDRSSYKTPVLPVDEDFDSYSPRIVDRYGSRGCWGGAGPYRNCAYVGNYFVDLGDGKFVVGFNERPVWSYKFASSNSFGRMNLFLSLDFLQGRCIRWRRDSERGKSSYEKYTCPPHSFTLSYEGELDDKPSSFGSEEYDEWSVLADDRFQSQMLDGSFEPRVAGRSLDKAAELLKLAPSDESLTDYIFRAISIFRLKVALGEKDLIMKEIAFRSRRDGCRMSFDEAVKQGYIYREEGSYYESEDSPYTRYALSGSYRADLECDRDWYYAPDAFKTWYDEYRRGDDPTLDASADAWYEEQKVAIEADRVMKDFL